MRGQPRTAICRMRVHELEMEIDKLQQFQSRYNEYSTEHAKQVQIQPKPRGPLGPRRIVPSEDTRQSEEEEDGIKVPVPPTPRISEYSINKAKKLAAAADPFLQIPAAKTVSRQMSAQNTISYDVDPPARTKSNPVTYTPGAPTQPKCPKCGSSKYHVH